MKLILSGKQCIKILKKMGWQLTNSDGSHRVFMHPEKSGTTTVPDHKEIAKGTLRLIIRQAQVSVEEFYNFLD